MLSCERRGGGRGKGERGGGECGTRRHTLPIGGGGIQLLVDERIEVSVESNACRCIPIVNICAHCGHVGATHAAGNIDCLPADATPRSLLAVQLQPCVLRVLCELFMWQKQSWASISYCHIANVYLLCYNRK